MLKSAGGSTSVLIHSDDSRDAEEKAKVIATHVASDVPPKEPRWIMVLDEEGNEVHRAAINGRD